ncbi:methylated-DNA-protein-cysteine methyltransferase related protein [Talaromyces islandicus]|uniref:Methylated-DNA-protein-cysteine methyltransferase related protein n=1 Tax=Talaromyces islandicus TaxID=28573 RepID=A0A0U1M0T9_TALIS|nr:methylated-DNA-protein-cysteine methyltransferase related protein [Talaromyces islandicus]
MPRTDEAEHWFNAVYEAVQEVPLGSVTTYGHIATLLGYPKRARQVGICLKHLPSNRTNAADQNDENDEQGEMYHHFHDDNVPWQRIVNSKGTISHRGPGSAARQADALRHEGVEVSQDAMGDYYIDMHRYGWFPSRLPSEDGETEDSEGEDGELFV